jgi:integrase
MRSLITTVAIVAAIACTRPEPVQTVLRVANFLPVQHPLFADVIKPWTEQVARVTRGRVLTQIVAAPLGPPDFAVAGVADVTYGVQILRHTFCSHLAMQGAPMRNVQDLVGHQSLAIGQRYSHLRY